MRVTRIGLSALALALVGLSTPASAARIDCVGGTAGSYRCSNVDLLAEIPTINLGGGDGSDIWGWTDPVTGTEYALIAMTTGTAFVDLSDPENPVVTGTLPSATAVSSWRDVKVYSDHAYIVSDSNLQHGMQVFDLSQLRTATPGTTFLATANYAQIGSAHNMVINEDSGYGYIVGGSSGLSTCSGGLHMVDLTNPALPSFAGCFSGDGYTHDAQCVMYTGPDPDHAGKEICMAANADTLTIVDVTSKSTPTQLSRTGYVGMSYAHQGWFTEDHRYFLFDDETDEINFGHNTKTYVWDVADLDNPVMIGAWLNPTEDATDHNQYVRDGFTYQANYGSGVRILDLTDIAAVQLSEVAYFDLYPDDDFLEHDETAGYFGAWSVYPFFESGIIIAASIEDGLFVLEPHLPDPPTPFLTSCTDPIFADGFEGGGLTSWDNVIDNDNDLSVTGAAALEGLLGLNVDVRVPGDKLSFVFDTSPAAENKYCFSFRIDADAMSMPEGRFLRVWGAQDTNNRAMAVVGVRNTSTGKKLGVQFRRDGPTYDPLPLIPMVAGMNSVEIEWISATAPGANDGVLQLYLNGALVAERDDLRGTRLLNQIGLGMLGKGAGVQGSFYVDHYESRR